MPKILRITATPRIGFYRAGMHHPAQPIDHPIETFSQPQLAALRAEPRLIVEEVELTDQPPAGGKGKKTKP